MSKDLVGFAPATIARLSWLRYVRPLFDADRAAAHDTVERRLRRAAALRYSREYSREEK